MGLSSVLLCVRTMGRFTLGLMVRVLPVDAVSASDMIPGSSSQYEGGNESARESGD